MDNDQKPTKPLATDDPQMGAFILALPFVLLAFLALAIMWGR